MADPWQKFAPLPLPVSPPASGPRLGDVPNDPIPVAARGTPSSPTPPAHGGDPWGVAGVSKTLPPALQYPTAAEFSGIMDTVYGKGGWTETGGWRSQERERQLHAQGALTVAPGHISPHSEGTMEQPAARDIVVRGMTPDQAAAVLARHGYSFAQLFPEGAHGNQGAHLHIGFHNAPVDPWAVASTAPAPGAPTAAPRSPQISGSVGGDGVAAGAGLGAALARQAHAPPAAPPPHTGWEAGVDMGVDLPHGTPRTPTPPTTFQRILERAPTPVPGLSVGAMLDVARGAAGGLGKFASSVLTGEGVNREDEAARAAQAGAVWDADPGIGAIPIYGGASDEQARSLQAQATQDIANPSHPLLTPLAPVTNAIDHGVTAIEGAHPNAITRAADLVTGFLPYAGASLVSPGTSAEVMQAGVTGDAYREAKARGASEHEAVLSSRAAGAVGAMIGGAPLTEVADAAALAALRRFAPEAMAKLASGAARLSPGAALTAAGAQAAAHVAVGAGQGAGMRIAENLAAIPVYDPNRSPLEGAGEGAIGGALGMGLFHAARLLPRFMDAATAARTAKPGAPPPADAGAPPDGLPRLPGPTPPAPPEPAPTVGGRIMDGAARAAARMGMKPPKLNTVPPVPPMPKTDAATKYIAGLPKPEPEEAPSAPETPVADPTSPVAAPPPAPAPQLQHVSPPAQEPPSPASAGDPVSFRNPNSGDWARGVYDGPAGGGFHRVSEPNGSVHEVPPEDIVAPGPDVSGVTRGGSQILKPKAQRQEAPTGGLHDLLDRLPPTPRESRPPEQQQFIRDLERQGYAVGPNGDTFKLHADQMYELDHIPDRKLADWTRQTVIDQMTDQAFGVEQKPQLPAPDNGATPTPQEHDGGVQTNLSGGDGEAGPGPSAVPAPERPTGGAPPAEVGGGARPPAPAPHGPTDVAGGSGEGPGRTEVGGGEGAGSDAGVPGPVGGPGPGNAGHAPAPDQEPQGGGEQPEPPAGPDGAADHVIEPGSTEEGRGPAQKARDNLEAIKIAKDVEASGRAATPEERIALAKYVGWGGLPGAFEAKPGAGYGKGFEQVGPALKQALTPAEHDAAGRSTLNAHYTAEHVIRSMWKTVQDMGFKGGDVFEPGMGVGHFKGMAPADVLPAIRYSGLEMDAITAKIAKALYPKSQVREGDFTAAPLPNNSFHLVIGNPPFHDAVIKSDKKYAARNFMLHDYFFAKSMDGLKPGGLMAFATSAGTMNKSSAKAREYLAQRAEFVGGVRLPSSAFKQNAGTEVTTDVLFFKKRAAPVTAAEAAAEPWTHTVSRALPDRNGGTTSGSVSRYFTEHPEQVLGQEGFFDQLVSSLRYAVKPHAGQDLPAELTAALDRLPKNILGESAPSPPSENDFGSAEVKDGSFYVKDGQLFQHMNGAGRPVVPRGAKLAEDDPRRTYTREDQEKIKALLPMRDALREVLTHDVAGNGEHAAVARQKLNAEYDDYVSKYGPINKAKIQDRRPSIVQQESARSQAREDARDRGEVWLEGDFDPEFMAPEGAKSSAVAQLRRAARERGGPTFDEGSFDPEDMDDVRIVSRPNIDPFMDDPESYRLRAIEEYDDDTGRSKKLGIFHESQITRYREPDVRSAQDAVLWSLNRAGRLDMPAMAEKLGKTVQQVADELGDRVFRAPSGDWVSSDEYLSGDVLTKLEEAQAAARQDPAFQRNVEALDKAKPTPLAPSQITMALGMPWIPAKTVTDFARDGLEIGAFHIAYNKRLGGWLVEQVGRIGQGWDKYSTPDVPAQKVLEMALNRAKAVVRKTERYSDGSKRTFVDPVASQALQDKIDSVKEAFTKYLGASERGEKLADLYNETQNRLTERKFDGEYLVTPGMTPEITLRPHQKRAAARVILSGNTHLAHAVGAGKTLEMIVAGMEMRRLGMINKPMFGVPNHMLGQFTKEFYEAYPYAKIMVADNRRFHTGRRKQFMADVANQDLDAVIITHSSFKKIETLVETQEALIHRELAHLEEALASGPDRFTKKQLEGAKLKMEQRLKGAMRGTQDKTISFEQMGVDFLFVDEAHLFRKLEFATRNGGMKGVDPVGSGMAWDLYAKIQYLEGRRPGRSVVLATGTPITNTMGELYTVSRYLQGPDLDKLGLSHFDSWAANFGDVRTALEQTAQGTYEPVSRFSQFVNAPELYKLVAQKMDIVTSNELEQLVVLPKLKGGKRVFVPAPFTDWLSDFRSELAARVTAIKAAGGKAEKGADIILNVINDGRHAAIDPRLAHADAGADHPSKLNMMIEKAAEIYHATKDVQFYDPAGGYKNPTVRGPATQMIFSDLGIHASEKRPFSAYRWMKVALVKAGVNPKEIAFMGDFKNPTDKQRLFNDMNSGKVRILIGSVPKMGVGTNAQKRLIAMHNMDPHWYPANDTQRWGRIVRQGNMNPEVQIYDYGTEGTYDATMWDMMRRKASFIEQFFRGDPNLRTMEDVGEAPMYEQVAAMLADDPRIMRLHEMRQEFDKLNRQEQAHDQEQYALRDRIKWAERGIASADEDAALTAKDIARRVPTRGDQFKMTVGDETFTARPKAAVALAGAVKTVMPDLKNAAADRRVKVAELGGFPITVRTVTGENPIYEWQRSDGSYSRLGSRDDVAADGVIRSAEERFAGLEDMAAMHASQKEQHQAKISSATRELGKEFEGKGRIGDLRGQISQLESDIATPKEGKPEDVAQAEANIRRFEGGGGQLNSGAPITIVADYAKVASYHTARFFTDVLGRRADQVGTAMRDAAAKIPAPAGLQKLVDEAGLRLDKITKHVNPMVLGGKAEMAAAKTFANQLRKVRAQWDRVDRWLVQNFTPAERALMYDAMDEHGTIILNATDAKVPNPESRVGRDQGLNRLDPRQRAAVDELMKRSSEVWKLAQSVGLVDPAAKALPYYVPRMLVEWDAANQEATPLRSGTGTHESGVNLRTSTPNANRQRKHREAADTEAAARMRVNAKAKLVRDIRTLPLALRNMEVAMTGRALVDAVQAQGKALSVPTVIYNGAVTPKDYFVHPHPAFTKWKIDYVMDKDTGAMVPKLDQNGNKVYRPYQAHILKTFEGPLKAVLQTPTDALWRDLMRFKGGMMSVIMFSPMMHNAVIWGGALPALGLKGLPLSNPMMIIKHGWNGIAPAYAEGYAFRMDDDNMDRMLEGGLVAINGRHNMTVDVTGIAEEPTIIPGRSWVAQLAGQVPKLWDKSPTAGHGVRAAVDRLGNFYHNTLLWDRIADLQAYIYKTKEAKALREGHDPKAASILAAQLANRYAGALPQEAMSKGARLLANLLLFSRSFTLGNMGSYKDVFGLPPELAAQIEEAVGKAGMDKAQGFYRRQAIGMFIADAAIQYLSLALGALAAWFINREIFGKEGWHLQFPWENEPGKENRILVGYWNGRGLYFRLPSGKRFEDLVNWVTNPAATLVSKLNPMGTGPASHVWTNDAGFGRKVWEPHGNWFANLARVGMEFATSVVPIDEFSSGWDLVTGDKDRGIAAAKTFLPLTGFTLSMGDPLGPAGGFVRREEAHRDFRVQEAVGGIKAMLQHGDRAGAVREMNAVDMPAWQRNALLRGTGKISGTRQGDYLRHASPEERARYLQARDRAAADTRRQAGVPNR